MRAVKKPKVYFVYGKSLSMVPGIQTVETPALSSCCAPLKEPFPPIITNPSKPKYFMFFNALLKPASSMNSSLLALPRMVPPL